ARPGDGADRRAVAPAQDARLPLPVVLAAERAGLSPGRSCHRTAAEEPATVPSRVEGGYLSFSAYFLRAWAMHLACFFLLLLFFFLQVVTALACLCALATHFARSFFLAFLHFFRSLASSDSCFVGSTPLQFSTVTLVSASIVAPFCAPNVVGTLIGLEHRLP